MSFTTISATTLGLADGDQSPTPVSGTVRITPRHPAGATTSGGVIATGPVIVTITGGAFPSTDVPARDDSTALVEFHLYTADGPVRMPDTEIPLTPGATISLRDHLPAGVDPATGRGLARGDDGAGITDITAENGQITVLWEGGGSRTIDVPDAVQGVGVQDATQPAEGKLALTLTDGSTTSQVALPPGPQGRDGSNVLPTDAAISQAITADDSATSTALRENFLEGRADEDQVALGPELITSTGWSLGTGWSGDLATGFTHATGNTAPLTWTPGFDPRSDGGYYMVQWTITSEQGAEQFNRADVNVHFGGGWAGITYQMDGLVAVYSRAIRATTGDPLTFAPASVFPSRIHDISVRRIGEPVAPVSTWRDESGFPSVELRAGGLDNLFIGKSSGQRMADANNPGRCNVTVGHNAMQESASGFFNTAVGYDSLRDLINGTRNVAVGYNSLMDLTTGDRNVGLGSFALARITEGRRNVAIGPDTLYQSERSNDNVTMGYLAQHAADDQQMTIAIGNLTMGRSAGSLRDIAIGERAMWYGGGEDNIAIGRFAARDTTNNQNVAIGSYSLWRNTGGYEQVAIGANAMRHWGTTSYENTAVGAGALLGTDGKSSGLGNTAIGNLAGRQLESGSQNTLIGRRAAQTMRNGSNNIVIGYSAEVTPAAGASNQLSIGNLIRGRLDTSRVGINLINPLGSLHLPSWGATDNIPLVFAPGPLADDPRAGGMEFGPDGLFITLTNGTRHRILTEPA